MVGIRTPVRENVLKQKFREVIREIGVNICDRDIQVCHRLKDKIEQLSNLPREFARRNQIFINKSLCPYCRGYGKNAKS